MLKCIDFRSIFSFLIYTLFLVQAWIFSITLFPSSPKVATMALRKVLNGTICRKGVAYIINSHTKTKTTCECGNLQKICGLHKSQRQLVFMEILTERSGLHISQKQILLKRMGKDLILKIANQITCNGIFIQLAQPLHWDKKYFCICKFENFAV